MKVFGIYDIVAEELSFVFTARTNAQAFRTYAQALSGMKDKPDFNANDFYLTSVVDVTNRKFDPLVLRSEEGGI